jgi:hypothetical protein
MSNHELMASLLRQAGWVVVPPAVRDVLPQVAVGQTWHSNKPRVEPRTVTKIGPARWYPSGVDCIYFATPKGRNSSLHPDAWASWVRKSGALPALVTE